MLACYPSTLEVKNEIKNSRLAPTTYWVRGQPGLFETITEQKQIK